MVNFCAPAETFGKGGSTKRHDHEFLGIHRLPAGVSAAIQDIHHWNGQNVGIHTTHVAVKWKAQGTSCRLGYSQAGSKNGICAEPGFIGGAICLDHGGIDGFLFHGIPADDQLGNFFVDMFNCLQHTLSAIEGFIPIPQFQGFMNAG